MFELVFSDYQTTIHLSDGLKSQKSVSNPTLVGYFT